MKLKTATEEQVYVALYNDILYKKCSNEMDVAIFAMELDVLKEDNKQKEAVIQTKGAMEAQILKQERALEWLNKKIKEVSKVKSYSESKLNQKADEELESLRK